MAKGSVNNLVNDLGGKLVNIIIEGSVKQCGKQFGLQPHKRFDKQFGKRFSKQFGIQTRRSVNSMVKKRTLLNNQFGKQVGRYNCL